ncbi:PP2C family protein-serine/threonine phosphatase [Krasilnikovia sp. MM14-A1259]|uniref:PP2C family protein-serine/threonine phosphatase n=1 Tax=Krasilnikovia sp. MM14-A1259 TaxID=3373539 RepID=UPI00399D4C55
MTLTECTSCVDERGAGAAFCEECGRPLTAAPATERSHTPPAPARPAPAQTGPTETQAGQACPSCGTPGAIGADGYCEQCGMLAGRPRDHVESIAGAAAAVTDRGRRHHRNEDAMFLAVHAAGIDAVVCDGVSASFDPDVASELAAETAGKLLAAAEDLPDQITAALTEAGTAVAALARTGDPRRAASNPACTIVAACVRGAEVGYGWVGDSRAYWLPASGDLVPLTVDDSWAQHAISLGADPQAAWRDPKAHAITAWLGADAGPVMPRTGEFTAPGPGHVVLCSDGLWNYLAEPVAFGEAVRAHLAAAAGAEHPLLAAARSLTTLANEAGGADNITVALLPVVPTTAPPTAAI